MALYELSSSQITIQVDSMGAELKSLKKTDTGTEYMWEGSPAYWKRTSPVLFPIVGSLRNGQYLLNDRQYPMSQHGFARDMEFERKSQTSQELWFCLQSNPQTLEKYPYEFVLEIGYEINEQSLTVKWRVKNPADTDLYFSIGGHPAFRCPIVKEDSQSDYKIWFDADGQLSAGILKDGLMSKEQAIYPLQDGCHYLTVSFNAPLFGIWSPPGKNAPFICIEPWYGRCDAQDFTGTWQEREWGQHLAAGEIFEASYQVTVC